MATQINQKQVLEAILTDCANHNGGDAMEKLKSLPYSYFTKTKSDNSNPDYPTARVAIEQACRIKPKDNHPLGLLRIKATPHFSNDCCTQVSRLAACMYHYPFHAANNVDPSADADMLLTCPVKDIAFKHFLLKRYSLMDAPHLFENGSPLLLPALVFQNTSTIKALLAITGAEFTKKGLNNTIVRHMELYQQQYGGDYWDQTFEDLRETMESRWHSNVAKAYKDYSAPGAYDSLSVNEKNLLTGLEERKQVALFPHPDTRPRNPPTRSIGRLHHLLSTAPAAQR